jgi:hypothetical protein
VRAALKEFFEFEKVDGDIAENYNIFYPYQSEAPYVYLYYAVKKLERRKQLPKCGGVASQILQKFQNSKEFGIHD